MNIGQIFGMLWGQQPPQEAKALELKVGQVVKGILLKWLNEQEALVNIGGVHVKARLAAFLRPGQAAFLQVQPESDAGQLFLKPLSAAGSSLPGTVVGEIVRDFRLNDSPLTHLVIRQMHTGEIPLTRENIRKFLNILPQGTNVQKAESYVNAGMLAFHRGIPLERETVFALHQVLYGKAFPRLLADFQGALNGWLSESGVSEDVRGLALRVQDIIARIGEEMDSAGRREERTAAGNPSPVTPAGSSQGERSRPAAANPQTANPHLISEHFSSDEAASRIGRGPALAAGAGLGFSIASSGQNEPLTWEKGTEPLSSVPGKTEPSNPSGGEDGTPEPQGDASRSLETPGEKRPAGSTPWILKFLKTLGLDYEHRLWRTLAPGKGSGEGVFPALLHEAPPSGPAGGSGALDTLKGLLLALSGSEEIPASVKESAGTLIQHLTGQQLLLASDRSAPMSHLILFIPFPSDSGHQTAAIHIQSRKNQRGGIDADNCRLWFDLNMACLGETLLDVRIVNRSVDLQIYSDYPRMHELIGFFRDELASSLEQWGYRLIGLKQSPLPGKTEHGPKASASETSEIALRRALKPYKGMDIRI